MGWPESLRVLLFGPSLTTFWPRYKFCPGAARKLLFMETAAKLERAGKALGNLDMLIAAHAISANATLVTRDKAFAQVEDLRPQ